MRFLLLLALWATLAFVPAWWAAGAYQAGIAAVAARVAVPGGEVEFTDLEIFYPFDLGIFVALCLASGWAAWRRRLRAAAVGLPILVAVEVAALAAAIRIVYGAMLAPDAAGSDAAYRLATGIIRVTGLIAAAATWLLLLGRERLSLAARAWLGSD